MTNQHVSLFTHEEHRVLSDWLGSPPADEIPPDLTVDESIDRLGYSAPASGYRLEDAVVAGIVLERIQERLPQWASVRLDNAPDQRVMVARQYRDRAAQRTVELNPQYLLTINWADSGPGFSWPVAYYAAWIPLYEVFVVTASADSPDVFGYCDFAIGSFGSTDDIAGDAGDVIASDWSWQRNLGEQAKWAYLFGTGLITEEHAERLAAKVWEPEEEEGDDLVA